MDDKPMPSAHDLERAVLGTCFLGDADAIDRIAIILRPEHFYNTPHKNLYRAILALHTRGVMVDVVSVTDHLERTGQLEKIGVQAVVEIAGEMATTANAEYHARMVRESYQKRYIITTAQQLISQAHEPMTEVNDLLSRLGNVGNEIAVTDTTLSQTVGESATDALAYYDWAREHPDELLGLPTGIPRLDEMTAGIQDTDLVLLAARPGEGKTSLGVWMARAMSQEKPGVMFNLEMSNRQVGSRFITAETGLVGSELRRGRISQGQYKELQRAREVLAQMPITIYDDVYMLDDIVSLARQHKRQDGIGWVMIDYLQLIRSTRRNGDNREQQIANISATLKQLAKDLDLPVIALSQLNRLAKGEKLRRPRLDDLRESGALEQDANVVIFPFRPFVHGTAFKELDNGTKLDLSQYAEIIIGKQREGELGWFKVRANMGCGQWIEWVEDDWIVTELSVA